MPRPGREGAHAIEVAQRTDESTGVIEEATFLGPQGNRIFGVLHRPPDPVGGLVICSPIFAEFEKNYRREVPLARSLAARGIAVQRFHYRGTGHSDDGDLTLDGMRDDARTAADALRERTGVSRLGVMGTRFGGLVGAAAAAALEGAPLALWDPAVRPAHYFKDVFRYRSVRSLRQRETGGPRGTDELLEELRRTGSLEVVGYPLGRALYESTVDRTFQAELGPGARPVLLVQFGQLQRPLRGDYRALADDLRRAGCEVDTAVASLDEAWLFAHQWQPPGRLLKLTEEWLARRLAGPAA